MNRLERYFDGLAARERPRRREFLPLARRAGRFPSAVAHRHGDRAEISVWCGNDYLGMAEHPSVLRTAQEALAEFGAGAGGSRNIGGTHPLHENLEAELAVLHGKDSALLFSSGYAANDGALTVLAGTVPGTVVFSDESNHASIIDGLRHSGAEKRIFRHNDLAHLEELLTSTDPARPRLIVTESVHSMSGAVAPVAAITRLARRHGASLYLDEVHAVGVYGPEGAGIAARDGVADEVAVVMGTLGKAFGSVGGYIAGPASLVETVQAHARPFIFTTSLPPATVAAALAAVRHLRASGAERARLAANARLLHGLLADLGIPVRSADSHIVSVPVGGDTRCRRVSAELLRRHGFYVQAVNAPSVPTGAEVLRIAPSAAHTSDDVRKFAEALGTVWAEAA